MDREGTAILPLSLLEFGRGPDPEGLSKRLLAVHALPVERRRPAGDLAELGAPIGALAHKVYNIKRSLYVVNTTFAQFAQSG